MNDEMGWLKKILQGDSEPEELCQELEESKVQVDGKWTLRHRLIVAADYDPDHNAWYNRELETRRACTDRLRADKQWWEYVDAHPKEFYPAVLEEIKDLTTADEWCHAVRSAWYLSDELWINRDAWLRIFSDRGRITGVTNEREAAYFSTRRDPLTIYRGCLPEHVDGLSWSLSIKAAEQFKREAGHSGVIFSGIVKKQHVLAYMNPNDEEFEIIVPPDHVTAKNVVS